MKRCPAIVVIAAAVLSGSLLALAGPETDSEQRLMAITENLDRTIFAGEPEPPGWLEDIRP